MYAVSCRSISEQESQKEMKKDDKAMVVGVVAVVVGKNRIIDRREERQENENEGNVHR